MARQLVNRLVMLRARGFSGPFAQRIGGGRLVHTAGNFIGSSLSCGWILASGAWNDTGCWDDTQNWSDA